LHITSKGKYILLIIPLGLILYKKGTITQLRNVGDFYQSKLKLYSHVYTKS